MIDSSTMSVVVNKPNNINQLFDELNKKNINVTSMRNESNRLEELFMDIVK